MELSQVHATFQSPSVSLEEFAEKASIPLGKRLSPSSPSYYVLGASSTFGPTRDRTGFRLSGAFSDSNRAKEFLDLAVTALRQGASLCITGNVARKPGGASLPHLPAVGMATHAILTSRQSISAHFLERISFDEGWGEQEIVETGSLLCTRALDAISSGEFLAAVQESHWAMARAVKPGLAKYYGAQWEEDEKPRLFGGPDTLTPVGTEKKDGVRTFEFTCYLEDGQHIRPMEIHAVRNAARKGQFHDHEFNEVRVVFNDQKTALQEAVPLLDVGSKVYFIGEDTELVELTADDVIRLRS